MSPNLPIVAKRKNSMLTALKSLVSRKNKAKPKSIPEKSIIGENHRLNAPRFHKTNFYITYNDFFNEFIIKHKYMDIHDIKTYYEPICKRLNINLETLDKNYFLHLPKEWNIQYNHKLDANKYADPASWKLQSKPEPTSGLLVGSTKGKKSENSKKIYAGKELVSNLPFESLCDPVVYSEICDLFRDVANKKQIRDIIVIKSSNPNPIPAHRGNPSSFIVIHFTDRAKYNITKMIKEHKNYLLEIRDMVGRSKLPENYDKEVLERVRKITGLGPTEIKHLEKEIINKMHLAYDNHGSIPKSEFNNKHFNPNLWTDLSKLETIIRSVLMDVATETFLRRQGFEIKEYKLYRDDTQPKGK